MKLRKNFLMIGLLTILVVGCARGVKVECARPIKPSCAPVVEEYKSMLAESQPRLRMPEPHEVVDMITCVRLLETTY